MLLDGAMSLWLKCTDIQVGYVNRKQEAESCSEEKSIMSAFAVYVDYRGN